MKISIVDGEGTRTKYICLGGRRTVEVDLSDDDASPQQLYLRWKTNIQWGDSLRLMRQLFDEARHYQRHPQDRSENESSYRVVALGRIPRPNELRLHPQNGFLEHENPLSLVRAEDVCINLLTSHYALHLSTTRLPTPYFDTPSTIERTIGGEEATSKMEGHRSLYEGIHHVLVSAYSNISGTLADIIATTSPAFAALKETAREILLPRLDQLLTQYPKPVMVN